MPKDLSKMTVSELEARVAKLDEDRAVVRAEMLATQQELGRRVIAQSATDKLARLSNEERRALLQMIEAEGVAGLEAFGELGAG